MALPGVGGNGGGSALDRFQQLRGAAQKKLEGADRQANLAELIQRKQKQLGAGASTSASAGSRAERIPSGPAAPGNPEAATGASSRAPAAAPSAVYGRSGAPRNQDSAPRLGRYVDFLA